MTAERSTCTPRGLTRRPHPAPTEVDWEGSLHIEVAGPIAPKRTKR